MARDARIRRLGLAALVLIFAVLAVADPVAAACKLTKIAEMPVRIAANLIEIDAQIDDQPVTLLVDTAASFSVLSPTAAEHLGLSIRDITDRDLLVVFGQTHAQTTVIQSLRLGAMVGDKIRVMVSDDTRLRKAGIAGVLGEDVLAHFDVEIDLPHGVLRLFKPASCGDSQMPYWAGAHYSLIPLQLDADPLGGVYGMVRLNDRLVPAAFDTGSATSMVRLSTSGAVAVRPDYDSEVPGLKGAWIGVFDTVTLGDETIHNARIRIADEQLYAAMTTRGSRQGPVSGGGTGMIVGLDFFRAHRVMISPSHHVMYFTYDGGAVFLPASPLRTAPTP